MRDLENSMTDGQYGPFSPAATSDTVEPRCQVIALGMRRCPASLREHGFQPGIAASCPSTEPFATAFAIPRADTSPGSQVRCRGELPHVHADFSNDHLRQVPAHSRNLTEFLDQWQKRGGQRLH